MLLLSNESITKGLTFSIYFLLIFICSYKKLLYSFKVFGFWDCHFFKSFTNFMSKQWFILQLQYSQNFREFLASDSKARVSRLSNSDSISTLMMVKVVSDSQNETLILGLVLNSVSDLKAIFLLLSSVIFSGFCFLAF